MNIQTRILELLKTGPKTDERLIVKLNRYNKGMFKGDPLSFIRFNMLPILDKVFIGHGDGSYIYSLEDSVPLLAEELYKEFDTLLTPMGKLQDLYPIKFSSRCLMLCYLKLAVFDGDVFKLTETGKKILKLTSMTNFISISQLCLLKTKKEALNILSHSSDESYREAIKFLFTEKLFGFDLKRALILRLEKIIKEAHHD